MSAELVQLRNNVRISQEVMIVFVAIIIWDTIATWPGEYRYLWKQDRSSLKTVFLVNRCWSVIAQVVTMALILARVPSGACGKIFWLEIFNSLSVLLLCGVLVIFRIYKTYDQNRKVLHIFITLLFMQFGVMIGAATQLRAQSTPADLINYLAAPGCSVGNPRINARVVAGLYWTPPLIFHMLAFGAVLYRDLKTTRHVGKWALAQRLADEGSFNLFVIVCSLIPNIALFIQPNLNLIYLNAPASITITSLMCSRMVLSQFVPSTTYGLDAPHTALRPSGNPASNETSQPYSMTLNSAAPAFSPLMKPGQNLPDLEEGRGGRGRARGSQATDEDEIEPISFTPVLGKDDRSRTNGEKESDEEDEKDKSESGSGKGVGLGMSV